MILRRLCEAASQFDLPPPGFQRSPIKWIVELDAQGNLLGYIRTASSEGTGRPRKNDPGVEMLTPFMDRSVNIAARLLADTADYALGYIPPGASDADADKVLKRHQAFLALLDDFIQATNNPQAQAVRAYLQAGAPGKPQELQLKDTVAFRVAGQLLIELGAVRQFWAQHWAQKQGSDDNAICLVCGHTAPVANPHPIPIKRLRGGQSSGCSLVSINKPAFSSYGHNQELTQCPVCVSCATQYALVLNALLASERHHYWLQDRLVYVFWTREPSDFDMMQMFFQPDPGHVQALLRSVESGREQSALDPMHFYALALSGSGGRVVVRDWLETTVGNVKANLARYFRALEIVDADGQPAAPPSLYALLASLLPPPGRVRDPWAELPPHLAAQFVHAVLTGQALPPGLLERAVARVRAEQSVTPSRAALLKLCLLLIPQYEEGLSLTASLNPEWTDPAYLCGRLLAILENIQNAAVPGAKSTLIDTYYGTASTAPASVFGLLMRLAQSHLAKLRKTNEPAYFRLQQDLEEVAGQLTEFPLILALNEQGKFALGYYQQRAAYRAARAEATAKKQAESENQAAPEIDAPNEN